MVLAVGSSGRNWSKWFRSGTAFWFAGLVFNLPGARESRDIVRRNLERSLKCGQSGFVITFAN